MVLPHCAALKGVFMTNKDKALVELLEKIDGIRWDEPLTSNDLDLIIRLLKGEIDSTEERLSEAEFRERE